MKRRQVLLAIAGVGLGAGLMAMERPAGNPVAAGVAAVVFKRLSYLTLEPDGVHAFAEDYASHHLMSAPKLRALAWAKWLYDSLPQSVIATLADRMALGEERIVTAYLLSTNFFPEANVCREVQYCGFFDPLVRSNPFARTSLDTRPATKEGLCEITA